MVWGGLGGSRGSWEALGEHVGGNLAPRSRFRDFWHPPGWPRGPMLGPSWRHVVAKFGHFGILVGLSIFSTVHPTRYFVYPYIPYPRRIFVVDKVLGKLPESPRTENTI